MNFSEALILLKDEKTIEKSSLGEFKKLRFICGHLYCSISNSDYIPYVLSMDDLYIDDFELSND